MNRSRGSTMISQSRARPCPCLACKKMRQRRQDETSRLTFWLGADAETL